ncbi:MAG: hypothetical protein F4Y57_07115 [Acidobacteria bacterium]|nr:hypothetical protein [Acidobacteriota bacterium]
MRAAMRKRTGLLPAALILALAAGCLQAPATSGQTGAATARVSQLARLLDAGTIVFGNFANFSGIGNAPIDAMTHSADENIDVVMYDLEHNPFDVEDMRTYMQFLLDPGALVEAGDMSVSKTIIARIPAYGRELEHNTWMVKSVLDAGVHGVVFPHIETAEQALTAVRAMRYPQEPDAPDFEPDGIRGSGAAVAARYWGLSVPDYRAQSDIWRLDPNGNLIPWFIIENRLAVENVRDIARTLAEHNIGAVLWAGTGDLSVSLLQDQEALAVAVDEILAAGKEFGLPVAMNGAVDVARHIEQGARIFMGAATPEARREAGR